MWSVFSDPVTFLLYSNPHNYTLSLISHISHFSPHYTLIALLSLPPPLSLSHARSHPITLLMHASLYLLLPPLPPSSLSRNWTCLTSAREPPARVEQCPSPARGPAPQKESRLRFHSTSRVMVPVGPARRLPPPDSSSKYEALSSSKRKSLSVYEPPHNCFNKNIANGSFGGSESGCGRERGHSCRRQERHLERG